MAITGLSALTSIQLNPNNVLGLSNPSQNLAPHGAVVVGNQAWVADNALKAFLKFNLSGVYQSRSSLYSSGGSPSEPYNTRPRGAALGGASGQYVLCVDQNKRIFVYNSSNGSHHDDISALSGSVSGTFTNYEGVAYRNGKIYLLDRSLNRGEQPHRVTEIGPNAGYTSIASISDTVQHPLKTASTDATDPLAGDDNNDPRGLAWISSLQEFWVLNGTTKEVFRYDASWNYLGKYALDGSITTPRSLVEVITAEGDANQVWVFDNGNDTIRPHAFVETTEVPEQVMGVTVAAVSDTSLRVRWTALSGITDYEVQVNDGSWMSAGADDTEFVIGNLSPSTSYAVKVRGVNANGNGPESTAVSATTLEAPVATTLAVVSGNNQRAIVGATLGNAFVVQVEDQYGNALSGVSVSFSVTSGGTLSAATDTTDEDGEAFTTLTLPETVGTVTVTASVAGLTAVTFMAVAMAAPLPPVATTLAVVSGNNQQANVGETLGNAFVVQVEDQYGNALSGVSVSFSVTSGGTLSAATDTTDEDGEAFTTLTLPETVGTVTVTASVAGLTAVTFMAVAMAAPLPPVATTLAVVSGNNQQANVGETLGAALVVQVDDQYDNPFSGATVAFSTTGGTLGTVSVLTDSNGRASTTLTLPDTKGTYTVTAAVAGLTAVRFIATASGVPLVTITSGYPNRYVRSIDGESPANLNDFGVYFKWDTPVAFDASRIRVTGAERGAFEKVSDTEFALCVRPPQSGSGVITVTVVENAVAGGNTETTATFNYTDQLQKTALFDWSTAIPGLNRNMISRQDYGPRAGIVVEGNRIRFFVSASGSGGLGTGIYSLTRAGVRKPAEDIGVSNRATTYPININAPRYAARLTKVNGVYYAAFYQYTNPMYHSYMLTKEEGAKPFDITGSGFSLSDFPSFGATSFSRQRAFRAVEINSWGFFVLPWQIDAPPDLTFKVREWDRSVVQHTVEVPAGTAGYTGTNRAFPVLVEGDRIYIDSGAAFQTLYATPRIQNEANCIGMGCTSLISENLPSFMGPQRGQLQNLAPDLDVYGQKLYTTGPWDDPRLYEIDLRRYRAPSVRQNIPPQFLTEGEGLALRHLVSGAVEILFEQGASVPGYLSIDSNLNLNVAADQISEDVCILVKLRAFSYRAETPFEFYLIVKKKVAPIWKAFARLPIDNGETVDMLSLVEGAENVRWRNGFTPPSGYTLSASGKLTVSNQTSEAPETVEMTAMGPHGSTDKTFVVMPRVSLAIVSSESFDFRLLVEDIDVTEDLLAVGSVRHSLDVINPNEFISDDASFTLSSDRGKYDSRVAGNFWDQNNLNKNGYLSKIELYVDIFDTGQTQSKLLFEGLIIEVQSSINNISVVLNCINQTYLLKNRSVAAVGLEKFSALSPVNETYQGEYAPDASLLPIVREGAAVVSGAAVVPIRTHPNASEGLTQEQEAYLTANDVFSSGGYLPEAPLLKFTTPYQRRNLAYLIKAVSEAGGFFNPKIDINRAAPAAQAHVASCGNVAFNLEKTKTLRTVVDWIHDRTNDIFYLLLGHPSAYIQDQLAVYNPDSDTTEHVKTFDAGIQVAQLTTQDFENFYILATTALERDWTEFPTPPNNDASVFDRWDSSRETEDTRILKFTKSTGAVTTFVDTDDAHPAQIGLHYMAGFENERHIRLREGVFSEARSTFKIHNNFLYYRFAKWEKFGVARIATTGGTTSEILAADSDEYFNTLNFDFDVVPNGDIYMPYSEGTRMDSVLKVRKYDAGADASGDVVDLRANLGGLTELDSVGGAFMGCHEAFYANDALYFVVPIERATLDESLAIFRDIRKSAGAVLYCMNIHSSELTVLERYDYVQLSCRSFVQHENSVYFAEHPNASTHYAPSNPDLRGWDSNSRKNAVSPNKVWLKRIHNNAIEEVSSPWYDGQPFTATAVRMLSGDGKLHAIVRYGDKFAIAAQDSAAAKPENEQWVTFGKDIPYFVEAVPSGSLHAVMVELAKLGNARLQITNNRLRFEDIDPYEALLSTGLSDSAGQLNYKDANKEFPSSGHVLINGEILKYTSRTAARLSGLTRGVGGSEAAAHTAGDRVLFLDKVINASAIEDPYSDINIQIDTNKFYNRIRDAENTATAVDAESVEQFGERTYRLDTPLSQHQIAWQQLLNAKTLNRLKDIKSIVRVRMLAAHYLDIGDIVMFAYSSEILMPIRITNFEQVQTGSDPPSYETDIIGEEVLPLPRIGFGNASVSDKTFTQFSTGAPFTLPPAENPKDSYVYSVEGLPTDFTFDPRTLQVDPGTPKIAHAATKATYSVTDKDNPVLRAELEFNITVNTGTLRFIASQPDITLETDSPISEQLVGAWGGDGRKTYTLTGNLSTGTRFGPIGRRILGKSTAAHGNRSLTLSATDESNAVVTDTFNIQTTLANRLMVSSGNSLHSYDFEGTRNTSEDAAPNGFTGFRDSGNGFWGGTVRGDRILLVERDVSQRRSRLFIYDRAWNRISSEEQTFANQYFRDIAWIPGGHWLFCKSARLIDFYTEHWVEQPSRQINVSYSGAYDIRAITATATRIYVLYERGPMRALTHDGEFIDGVGGNAGGGASSIAVTPEGIVVDSGNRLTLYDLDLRVIRTIRSVTVPGFIALNPRRFLED